MRALFVVPVAPAVFALAAGLAASARASERTAVAFVDDSYEAAYSQAVALELNFVDKNGAPLDGTTACGSQPCRVAVEMQLADGSEDAFDITAPDVTVDAAGRARVRLTLVDGRHSGATFAASVDGVAYTLTARFRGVGNPLPVALDEDCIDGAPGTADGRLCPSTGTATVTVFPEVPSLSFSQDIVMGIGERVVLAATVTDANGDADVGGSDVDGPGPKNLEGLPVRFAYDRNDDGSPNFLNEGIGEAFTNAAGVASLEFFADPAFAQAGSYEAGLHAEFPGDDHYAVARTAVRLQLTAGAPDPAKTIIEIDPNTPLPADGTTKAEVRVRLLDSNNNLLGPEAPLHEVAITTDLGLLIDDAEVDPLDGIYKQVFRVGRKGGTATLHVTVDGEDAGTAEIVIDGPEGCTCTSSNTARPLALVFVGLAVMRVRRRRPAVQVARASLPAEAPYV